MKYAYYIKLSSELVNDQTTLTLILKREKNRAYYGKLKNSIKLTNFKIRFGQDGDDFVRDVTTALLTFKGYKINRIIKKHLLK